MIVEAWEDIRYAVELNPNTHWCDFRLVSMVYSSVNGVFLPHYEAPGTVSPAVGAVTDITKAHAELSGSVKWDGCSNVDFGGNGAMLHFCGPEGWWNLFEAIRRTYKLVSERGLTEAHPDWEADAEWREKGWA